MQRILAGFLFVALTVLASCGDDIQFSAPPDKSPKGDRLPAGHPPLAATTPAGTGTPPAAGTADPFADPAEAAHGTPPSSPATKIDRSKVYFTGTVTLDPAFKPAPGSVLFINAGNPPEARPPVLSKRIVNPVFPLAFSLTGAEMAFGDTTIDSPLVLRIIYSELGELPPAPMKGEFFRTVPTAPTAPGTVDIPLTLKKP